MSGAGNSPSSGTAVSGSTSGSAASGTGDSGSGTDASDAASCTPITHGLLGHWTMDAASISGTTLADSSGNHNDGTLVGFSQPETAAGRFGDALVYPATAAAYVTIPTLPLNGVPGGMNTVSMWYYRNPGTLSEALALLPNSPRYDLWLAEDGNYLCMNTGQGECMGIQANNLLGRWVHVVAIFVNGPIVQNVLYVDGQNKNAACVGAGGGFASCGASPTAAAPVIFGGQTDFNFHGMLDDVRIYNRALTASEASALYQGTACP
jgi:hypothetical protein